MSIAILGLQGTQDFINILLISAGGEWYGMKESSMYNLIGLLSRWFTFLNPQTIRTIGWIAYIVAILAIFFWSARTRNIESRHLSWIILVCVLAVPHFHFHDLTLLLFPLITVGLENQRLALPGGFQFVLHPMTVSFIMLVGFFDQSIQFVIPYLIIAALAIFLFRQERFIPRI